MKEVEEIIGWLEANKNTKNKDGMARYAIKAENAYGVPLPALRKKAREYRKRQDVALELWNTGIHEAQLMASMVADPAKTDEATMDKWTGEFDSWDICDQCCSNLFRQVPYVYDKVKEYVTDDREFVRRTGFVLIATLAVHDKASGNERFCSYFETIEKYSTDDRNFVRKAVNWALRQIGKRNMELNEAATEVAAKLAESENATTRWVGKDALKELTSPKTIQYIKDHRE